MIEPFCHIMCYIQMVDMYKIIRYHCFICTIWIFHIQVIKFGKNKNYIYMFLQILDINECSISPPCHANAACNNTVGSYLCTCNQGYSGNGSNCSGIVWIWLWKIDEFTIRKWWQYKNMYADYLIRTRNCRLLKIYSTLLHTNV